VENDNAAVDVHEDAGDDGGGGEDGGVNDTAPRSEQTANHVAGASSSGGANNHGASRRGSVSLHRKSHEDDEDFDDEGGRESDTTTRRRRSNATPPSRPKSRIDQGVAQSKYNNLSYWRARKVLFYKNGDPFFPGVEFRFKPGRDIVSLESLLDKLSLRMDLPRGARYVFSMDGDRKLRLEELEDGASYVVSSYKTFKGSTHFEEATLSKTQVSLVWCRIVNMSM
ncbi:hypothetical protein L9F63_012747, partial [Diploptera punctata]